MRKKILVIHGPNINMTGFRDRTLYGGQSIEEINGEIQIYAEGKGLLCEIRQTNHEGQIIDWLHESIGQADGVIINAGAYSHYSFAIRDAIELLPAPCVEVHLSNIAARDPFRQNSVLSAVCAGVLYGFGKNGYLLAVDALLKILA